MSLVRIHALVAWLLVVAIAIQVFLAGAAISALGGSGSFVTHRDVGYSIGLIVLALLVTAIVARRPRREIGISALFLVLYVVQTSLPYARESVPAIAALHPVGALVLFAAALWYARGAWQASAASA